MPSHGISHAGIDTDGSALHLLRRRLRRSTPPASRRGATVRRTSGATTPWPDLHRAAAPARLARMTGMSYIKGTLYYFGGARPRPHPRQSITCGARRRRRRHPVGRPGADARPAQPPGWGVIGGKIYVVGGEHHRTARLAQAELDRYDPVTDTWRGAGPGADRPGSHTTGLHRGHRRAAGRGGRLDHVQPVLRPHDRLRPGHQHLVVDDPPLPLARTSTTMRAVSGDPARSTACGSAGGVGRPTLSWIGTPAP